MEFERAIKKGPLPNQLSIYGRANLSPREERAIDHSHSACHGPNLSEMGSLGPQQLLQRSSSPDLPEVVGRAFLLCSLFLFSALVEVDPSGIAHPSPAN